MKMKIRASSFKLRDDQQSSEAWRETWIILPNDFYWKPAQETTMILNFRAFKL